MLQFLAHFPLRLLAQFAYVLLETALVDWTNFADKVYVVVVTLEKGLTGAAQFQLLLEHLSGQCACRDVAQQTLRHHLTTSGTCMAIEDAAYEAVAKKQTRLGP